MGRVKLKEVYFKQLKGLRDVTLTFDGRLTAIMGVNGVGKSTVVHALACLFRPSGTGTNYRFSDFFIPNTDSLWSGSELIARYQIEDREGGREVEKRYAKDWDRWSPRYNNRPSRDVHYLGIDTCIPEIEKKNSTSRITYSSQERTDSDSRIVLKEAAYILNLDYDALYDNVYRKEHLDGVSRRSGLKYSSLSMGTGEQRVIRILDTVVRANKNSLVLIDEVDLLLHVCALRKLIEVLSSLAEKQKLQIVFTTHSLEMLTLTEYVDVIYLYHPPRSPTTLALREVTSDLIYELTGSYSQDYCIYVEDSLSEAIIRELLKRYGVLSDVRIVKFGAASNAYALAAAHVLAEMDLSKVLVVLDGDKLCSDESRRSEINRALTGTERDADERRDRALSIVTNYNIPEGYNPECFLSSVILHTFPQDDEIYQAAASTRAVNNNHEWLGNIYKRTSLTEREVVQSVFNHSYKDEMLRDFLQPVKEWVEEVFPSRTETI
ncbi:ATP-dependent nuclease [Adlercreutzia caecimuris]|uniref:ATP-dependent nuclease n=1 Tax=Adlercreutzia caecimuris TaxID=671266 RepID=UPI002585169D|nr:AAA family ATPase [Adlercreutzia caecimuris]